MLNLLDNCLMYGNGVFYNLFIKWLSVFQLVLTEFLIGSFHSFNEGFVRVFLIAISKISCVSQKRRSKAIIISQYFTLKYT